MRTLRECNRMEKIKNRYNITMVYNSKIITKKHNKTCKKQMGGEGVNGNNIPPTLKDNIKKFADIWLQIFNNLSMYTLDKIENKITDTSIKLGINPNNSFQNEIAKVGQKAEELNNVLDTPEGKKALSNLTSFFNKITQTVIIPSSERFAEELIKQLEPILVRGQNAIFALLSASPFGAVIDIPRFLSESLGVVEKSVTLADNVLDIGNDTVNQLKDEQNNFNSVVSNFSSLMEKTNTKLSSGLDSIKNRVDDYGKNMMEKGVQGYDNNVVSKNVVDINNSLKKYQNETKMVGGRVRDSYSEFTKANVTSQKILKQYGGTRKRRILKRNILQSRRHK